jgi:hypothetical protein
MRAASALAPAGAGSTQRVVEGAFDSKQCRVGKGAQRRAHLSVSGGIRMSRYRRATSQGSAFFFTLALADRSSDLLVREIERLHKVKVSQVEKTPERSTDCNIRDSHVL